MYNPSRGGVRGGADQFSWESVKTDKHRENYLGHSLKAPVGRWQKGKDLSWYVKSRKDVENPANSDKSELASIKKAEEEAMLIALGHNIARKESQTLTKEEMREALKRNIGERDDLNIERVDGVGAMSGRAALLAGIGKDSRGKNEGMVFESRQERIDETMTENQEWDHSPNRKKRKKKSSKKHKKEKKKHKKHHKDFIESEEESDSKYKSLKRIADYGSDENTKSSLRKKKKSKHKHSSFSSNSESDYHSYSKNRNCKKQSIHDSSSAKNCRHDTSDESE